MLPCNVIVQESEGDTEVVDHSRLPAKVSGLLAGVLPQPVRHQTQVKGIGGGSTDPPPFQPSECLPLTHRRVASRRRQLLIAEAAGFEGGQVLFQRRGTDVGEDVAHVLR